MRVAFPLAGVLAPEAHLAVGIPIAVANPSAAKVRQAWKAERRYFRSQVFKRDNDFLAQVFGDNFIRINRQQPWLGGMGGGEVAVRRVTTPRLTKNFRAELAGDFVSAIRDGFVNGENDLGGPAPHTFQSAANAVRFIAGNKANRDRQLLDFGRQLNGCFSACR